jgi:hypothetical protein
MTVCVHVTSGHHYGETCAKVISIPLLEHRDKCVMVKARTSDPCTAGEYSSKELISQMLICLFGASQYLL